MVATLASLLFVGTLVLSLAVILGMTSSRWTQMRVALRNIAPLGLEGSALGRGDDYTSGNPDPLVSLSALPIPARW